MAGSHPQSILIADDEHHIRFVLGDKLRKAGYSVIEACDGEEALTLTIAHLPGLIISDLQMPRKSGLDFCIAVKENPLTAHIPAILLTSRGYLAAEQDVSKTAICETIAKPFSAKEVLERVQALLAQNSNAQRRAA